MPEKKRIQVAFELSEEILGNIELSEIPPSQIILKCLRLARLLNDYESLEWLKQETNGFEKDSKGFLTSEVWDAAKRSGRTFLRKEEDGTFKTYVFTESIAYMESVIEVGKQRLDVSYDPDVSISSHSEYLPILPSGNKGERNVTTENILKNTTRLDTVKSHIYGYILNVNYELQFGNITEAIFTNKREFVDKKLLEYSPKSTQQFISIYENLQSGNEEDWANAVHSCRRILKEIADQLYPPSDEPILSEKGKKIKVGKEQYINRLIAYIESKSASEKFESIVGSHLKYMGERIDSIYEAANKGTHDNVTYEEAERYIIYTYLILGDILSL